MDSFNFMKTLITFSITLVLLATIGCQSRSAGGKAGGIDEHVHMSHLIGALESVNSGTDGVGKPSLDSGIRSFFY